MAFKLIKLMNPENRSYISGLPYSPCSYNGN